MGASAPPVGAREAAPSAAAPAVIPAAGSAAAEPVAGAESADDEPQLPQSIAEAAARARELLAAEPAEGAEVVEGAEPAGEETPEAKEAREAAELELRGKLVVKGPGLRGDDGNDAEFEIEASDEESANVLRTWVKGYVRGEQAKAIRQQAQQIREQADEIELGVQLDPLGFITNVIKQPADLDHLFRSLATQKGVLERNAQWIGGLLDAPEAIDAERTVIEADDIKRRDTVGKQIQTTREIRKNAQALVDTTYRAIEQYAPGTWDDDAKGQLYKDIMSDLQEYARANKLVTIDPRVISGPKGLVGKRLARFGVAVTSEAAPSTPGKPAAAVPKAAAPKVLTAEDLIKNRTARRAAGSVAPGAGSPVATVPKPPAYDPKDKRSAIQQAADFAKGALKALNKRPQ